MKSLILKSLAVVLLATGASCSKDALREYDKKQQLDAVESVNDPFLLSSVIKQTSLFYQGFGYDNSKLPSAVQYMQRNFQGGDNTYSGFKQPSDDLYAALNILKLIDGSIRLTQERGSKSHEGIFTTFRVLLFSYITDFYGDIYYTEALKGREGILYPNYDHQSDIYDHLLVELDNANALIAAGTDPLSNTYDLMFAGDKVKWQKFTNSLKLRLLMRASAKIPDAGAKMAAILANPAVTPIFTEADDNASISYIGSTKDDSWKGGTLNWVDYSEYDRRRPCKTLVDKLASLNDPRMKVWIAPIEQPWTSNKAQDGQSFTTTDPNGFTYSSTWEFIDRSKSEIAAQSANILDSNKVYAGFIAGMPGDYKNGNGHYNTTDGGVVGNFKVSKYAQLFRQNSHPLLKAMVMQSDEVEFILAEAAVKGMISGDADTYYRKGIEYSLKRWGVSSEDITTYLSQSSIALPADNAGKLAKIADQKWLGLFFVSTEAYLDVRRTHLPDMFNNGNLSTYEFPSRYRYPGAELGQNRDAYDAGVSALSPAVDNEYSKMWLLQ
ncbi:SusD/RagB family nutrient-binding outer membrane lipoprotein [Flavihumibacter fluvii]|uniref:SusD/RagB family nutrient-binding outer membrane lipoprotein n=1 Tax=Flavihumibacter fluvii TaxID=2838157 RepID=UPI001BDE4EE1|nr:SusD/RagB family nutrient-binding outer membrane lipoprotein [Flavihumibacter fluvii]ULQ54146.1 SusD/RagB family nutrient-binding outer membrane lipoprotein [Flavihumibacter fluvii]